MKRGILPRFFFRILSFSECRRSSQVKKSPLINSLMNLLALPFSLFAPAPTASSQRNPPGRVACLHGIIIQSDASSSLGKLFIRPVEALDLWFAGLLDRKACALRLAGGKSVPLGMHAGIHAGLEDGRHFVVEQLAGGLRDLFVGGLHWTPLDEFQGRERRDAGGWDVTIPLRQFREMNAAAEENAIGHLNNISAKPFLEEDCTGFVGRVFGRKRRIFADSPILRSIGVDMRSGEPALPLLGRQARMDAESERLLHAEVLRDLPDPAARSGSLSLRQLHHRLLITGAIFASAALFVTLLSSTRRGRPDVLD
jgi:hypothetical protein